MKRIGIAISLFICTGSTTRSQEKAPLLLIRAAQCLVVKDFLPPSSRTKALNLGYFVDEKSYPGDKVLYVVNFTAPVRSSGQVFAIFLPQQGDLQSFNIQNNASFVPSRGEMHGVLFKDPPLGGGWTQERLAAAVEQIEKQLRFTLPVANLAAEVSLAHCESYADQSTTH